MDNLILIILAIIFGLAVNYYLIKYAIQNAISQFEIDKYKKQQEIENYLKRNNEILEQILNKLK